MAIEAVQAVCPRPAGRTRSWITLGQSLFVAIVAGGFLIRIWDVGSRAMHLDESTVAWFGWQLLTGHGYAYDPVYHGPFQHEMLALIFLIFEPSQTSARLLAVVLGTALVALPWFIRDYLGRFAALSACLLIAISPSFVYFARFERDDTYMEFFTFALVVLILRFMRDRKVWQLYAAVITFALAFATKESIYIVAFIFGSYLGLRLAGGWLSQHSTRLRETLCRLEVSGQSSSFRVAVALCLLGPLLATIILTVQTGLYLPAPAVMAALCCIGVLVVSASVGIRRVTLRAPSRSIARFSWMCEKSWRAHWISAATIAIGILVLMYSTFGMNLDGLWDRAHAFFNANNSCPYPLGFGLDACRKDIVGGLFYWLSQHKVARGGQPWYYYLLIYGLYEQLAVVLGLVALARTTLSARLSRGARAFRMFVIYWAVLSLLVYSWAGEKFPWLGIHPLLPITLLAAIGVADLVGLSVPAYGALRWQRAPRVVAARAGLVLCTGLLALEVHNTITVNFVDSANPVEMMVYVQSSPDTISDANLISSLSHRETGGNTMPVSIDSNETWPFGWYLRDMPDVGYPAGSQAADSTDPVIILDQTDADSTTLSTALRNDYARQLHRLDWWFPENYKSWDWRSFLSAAVSPSSWQAIWDWETDRVAFGPRDGTWYYLYLKKGYFPAF